MHTIGTWLQMIGTLMTVVGFIVAWVATNRRLGRAVGKLSKWWADYCASLLPTEGVT